MTCSHLTLVSRLAPAHSSRVSVTVLSQRVRQALINENKDLAQKNGRYVMGITGDDTEGTA